MLGACVDTARDGPESYVVRPDDTLYSIAWRHDVDFRDLARWNNLGGDYRIAVGQVLLLGPLESPSLDRGAPRTAANPGPTPVAGTGSHPQGLPQVGKPRPLPEFQANGKTPAASNPASAASPPAPAATAIPRRAQISTGVVAGHDAQALSGAAGGSSRWVWPTDRVGALRPVPGGGILLSGRLGQDVRAASAGRVVYAGSGLRGYGNLIIIKHADSLLSAYAHNRELLVHDGQEVSLGQVIAHMGEGGHGSPTLYFEIRQNGKPVDPMLFLSKVK